MASILQESGNGWWAVLDGRQLSPASLADGSSLLGTARIVLAATALARGYHDRRWATSEEAASLGYGPYRNERPTNVPVLQHETVEADGVTYAAMLNAEQLRGAHGGGMRAGTPVPPEQPAKSDQHATIDAIARAAMSLAGNRTLVSRIPKTWDARRASRLVEAAALSSMRDCLQADCNTDADAVDAFAMAANLAAAITLSDLGIPPACACNGNAPARAIALRWAEAIQRDPSILFARTTRAERLAATIVEATRDALEAMADEEEEPVSQPPTPKNMESEERSDSDDDRAHDERDRPAATSDTRTYTLRSVAEESRLASKALAGFRSMGR